MFKPLKPPKPPKPPKSDKEAKARGGAIGNSLTEKLGKLMMKRFDKKNLSLLKKLKVETEMSKTYIDDNTVAMKSLDAGVRFDAERMNMVDPRG